jgi:hypothetical protein
LQGSVQSTTFASSANSLTKEHAAQAIDTKGQEQVVPSYNDMHFSRGTSIEVSRDEHPDAVCSLHNDDLCDSYGGSGIYYIGDCACARDLEFSLAH